jgi:DNA-binding MarR family transcriptional regulator
MAYWTTGAKSALIRRAIGVSFIRRKSRLFSARGCRAVQRGALTHHTKHPEARQAMSREKSAERLERSPVHLLHRAGQCAGDIFQSEMASGVLTPRQYAVLTTVAHNEGLSQTNLVDRTGIDRSTLADIIRRMLKKGLIQRRRTREDARAYAVKLSEEGWRVLKSAEPMARRIDDKIMAALPSASRERFLQDLNVIVTALGADVPATSGKSKS